MSVGEDVGEVASWLDCRSPSVLQQIVLLADYSEGVRVMKAKWRNNSHCWVWSNSAENRLVSLICDVSRVSDG